MYRAVIIDDEKNAREVIRTFLEEMPQVEVAGEAADGYEGARMILKERPDLVFLDVRMPRLDGFEMLELLDDKPAVIFTTAYHEHALKAFEVNATDFLLKPFPRERFLQAVEKALAAIRSGKGKEPVERVVSYVQQESGPLQRIVVKKQTQIIIIPLEEIRYLQAQDDYTGIHTGETSYLKKQTLSFYATHLPPDRFVRVHRSYIVAVGAVSRLEPYGKNTWRILLHDGEKIPVSRSGLKELKRVFRL
jgi:two-component system LytT family response regulator